MPRTVTLGIGRLAVVTATTLGLVVGGVSPTPAQEGGPPPIPPECDVIAEGLVNPRGIAVGDDGTVNVALLSEAWPADAPNVVRLVEDGSFEPVASGLTGVVDLAAGADGALYAAQIWSGFDGDMPLPGSVERILPNGSTERVMDGLFLPHGVAVDDAGNLYVTVNSIAFGPEAAGQLLRCEGMAGGEAGAVASPAVAVRPNWG
jgi:hypothetical protein